MESSADRAKPNRDAIAVIGPGIDITGDVESQVEMQLGGRISGEIRCQTLFIDESGEVYGNVRAERVRVSGLVEGDIDTVDLAIEAGGRVNGSVTYARLKVTPGGMVNGTLTHRAAEPAATEASNLKLVDPVAPAPAPVRPATPRRVYSD